MQTLVSIIIPTYNRAHLIGETLDSIINQTYLNWECIIVDDGSTDYTRELLGFYREKDSRLHYHPRPEKRSKGANSCRNYGFELSKGGIVNWFDDDDIMLEGFIEAAMGAFVKGKQFVIAKGYYVAEDLSQRIPMKMEIKENLFKSLVLWESHIITNSVVFRKSFLDSKKLFNTKISRGQEAEFFTRIFLNLPDSYYQVIEKHQYLYRQHLESKTHKNKSYVNNFKESEAFIVIRNLKYSVDLRDRDLIIILYNEIKKLFFESIEHHHTKNSIYILKQVIPVIWKINKRLSLKWVILGFLILMTGKNSYTLGKPIRRNDIL